MSTPSPLLKPAVWVFYLIVGLEFLFMISPLGFFFYSSYGPLLNSLHAYPATAWLTGFFLPHVSFTDSELVNSIKPWGFRIAGFGLLVFLIGVVQIYGAKLLRRKEVTALTHHPRRTGAAIVTSAYGRRPVVRVRVDLAASTVEAVESPPVNVVWGDIPTPMY